MWVKNETIVGMLDLLGLTVDCNTQHNASFVNNLSNTINHCILYSVISLVER